jgi:hypothetical protein
MKKNSCKTCYQIACKKCDWVATEEEVLAIKKGELTACPQCSWKPDKES